MKSHLFNGRNFFQRSEVISLELSHRVSDFWLIARRRCERQTPLNPSRGRGRAVFSFFFFSRELTLKGGGAGGEVERSAFVFFNHPEKEPERVASYVWIGGRADGRGEREPVHGCPLRGCRCCSTSDPQWSLKGMQNDVHIFPAEVNVCSAMLRLVSLLCNIFYAVSNITAEVSVKILERWDCSPFVAELIFILQFASSRNFFVLFLFPGISFRFLRNIMFVLSSIWGATLWFNRFRQQALSII